MSSQALVCLWFFVSPLPSGGGSIPFRGASANSGRQLPSSLEVENIYAELVEGQVKEKEHDIVHGDIALRCAGTAVVDHKRLDIEDRAFPAKHGDDAIVYKTRDAWNLEELPTRASTTQSVRGYPRR